MAALTLANMRDQLDALAGLDLTDSEANALINEAHRELCIRTEWTRRNVELGPTVANQAAYPLGTRIQRPLKLRVGAYPYQPSSEYEAQRVLLGELRLSGGLWWLSFDADGVESVSLYPTPTTAGDSITVLAVTYPDELTADGDTPVVPAEAHRAILDYVQGIALGNAEDNPELREFHMASFDRFVEQVRRDRLSRVGRGPIQMRVEGWTA